MMSFIIVELPPAPGWVGQDAYELIFGQVPRIVLASLIAFFTGEMINAYVMARMKIWTKGKYIVKDVQSGRPDRFTTVEYGSNYIRVLIHHTIYM